MSLTTGPKPESNNAWGEALIGRRGYWHGALIEIYALHDKHTRRVAVRDAASASHAGYPTVQSISLLPTIALVDEEMPDRVHAIASLKRDPAVIAQAVAELKADPDFVHFAMTMTGTISTLPEIASQQQQQQRLAEPYILSSSSGGSRRRAVSSSGEGKREASLDQLWDCSTSEQIRVGSAYRQLYSMGASATEHKPGAPHVYVDVDTEEDEEEEEDDDDEEIPRQRHSHVFYNTSNK